MKQAKWAVIAGALVLGGTASAMSSSGSSGSEGQNAAAGKQGAQGTGSSQANASNSSSEKSVVGTVEKVQGDTLTLKNRLDESRDFQLGKNTKYIEQGKKISKDDVKQGDEVRAAFRTGAGGELEATSIRVMRTGQDGASGTGSSSSSTQKSSQSGSGPHGSSGSSGSQ